MKHGLYLAVVLMGGMCLVGCLKKKVDVTFTNFTNKQLEVDLRGPGEGAGLLGAMPGLGGRVSTTLEIPRGDLPAHYAWTAGEQQGRFTVVKKTPRLLNVDVGTPK